MKLTGSTWDKRLDMRKNPGHKQRRCKVTQRNREEVKKAILEDVETVVDSIQEMLEILCPSLPDCEKCYYNNLCIDEGTPKEEQDGADEVILDGKNS